jgi:hypothetical protein
MTCTRDEGRYLSTESVGLILDRGHTCIIMLAFTLLCAVMHHLSMLKQLGTGAHVTWIAMRGYLNSDVAEHVEFHIHESYTVQHLGSYERTLQY